MGPAQTQNKKTRHRPNSKKVNTPPTLPSVVSLLFGRVGVFFVLLFGLGGVFVFCCLGGGMLMFLLLGRGACCFLPFGRVPFFFCCLGGWRFLFFFCCLGGGREFRSAWLVFQGPNNKKDQTAKKKKRVPIIPA